MQLVGGRVVGELESHHPTHRVPDHQRVLDVERVEHRQDVSGHAPHGRRALLGNSGAGIGAQLVDETGSTRQGEARRARHRRPVAPEIGSDDPVVQRQVAQLMGPQCPAQHEPVQQHDRWSLAALDDVDGAPVVDVDDALDAVVGNGEALRRDVIDGGVRARH